MEKTRNDVFSSAREGRLDEVKSLLVRFASADRAAIVNDKSNGATPLMAAARNGHLGVVHYLVDECMADVETVGCVEFDGETIEGAPPLWCAAAAGHFSVVEFLHERGARLNSSTHTNSTPLRAACFDGHFRIVKYLVENGADIEIANRHGHTCLMIACYKGHYSIVNYLLKKGAQINRSSVKGNTALHDAAEAGSLEIMELLLLNGANISKDCHQMTPLASAAVTGHPAIVEFLINRSDCPRIEKINALELLGATYIDKKRDLVLGVQSWKRAMHERHNSGQLALQKQINEEEKEAYGFRLEFQTLDELNQCLADPDDLRMQALLVRERILGPVHPDTSYYVRYRGAVCADLGDFTRCISLWLYAIDMQQTHLEPLNLMTQSSLLSFAELFAFMSADGRSRPPMDIDTRDMVSVFTRAVNELEKSQQHMAKSQNERDRKHLNRLLLIIMHLLALVSKQLRVAGDSFELKQQVFRFLKLDPQISDGQTPLHLCASMSTTTVGKFPVCKFPSSDVARVLVELGADVNALDIGGNTPLHIATSNAIVNEEVVEVVKILLNSGSHLDFTNRTGYTAVKALTASAFEGIVFPMQYISLQCLAAATIKRCRIPFERELPPKVVEFVRLH